MSGQPGEAPAVRVLHFADLINQHDFIHNVMAFCDPRAVSVSAATLGRRGSLSRPGSPFPVLDLSCDARRRYPRAVLRLRRVLRRDAIDVVHAHHFFPGLLAVAAAWGTSTRVVLGRHYSDAIYQLARGLKRRLYLGLEALCNRRAGAVVVPSRVVEELLLRQGVPAAKVARIPYGFDFERFGPREAEAVQRARREWGEEPGLRLATFGRLHPEKGHRFLLEAMALLAAAGHRATLLVAGEGREREALQRQAAAARLDVRLVGWRTDVLDLMAAADVVVQPSLQEAFSQVMVEAMALGRPLVISEVGGVADVVEEGVSGLVVPPARSEPLAQAIRRLADPATASKLGARAGQRVREMLDIRRLVRQVEALYHRVAA